MAELSTSFNVDKMARFPGLPLATTHAAANNVSNEGLGKNLLFEQTYTSLQGNGEVQEGRIETKNEAYSNSQLTLRALVSTKEAGIIIGRQGKNVAELRGVNGIKAGVSKVVPNIYDRVLTISGTLEGVSKVYRRKKKDQEKECLIV